MDRKINTTKETYQTLVNDLINSVNNTLPEDMAAFRVIDSAAEEGLLYSAHGREAPSAEDDDILSMSNVFSKKNCFIAEPDVINGTKSAEDGVFYKYTEYSEIGMGHEDSGRNHKVEKMSFKQLLDFVNFDNDAITRPAKPKLGFWGTIRNALSGVFGKPEGQKKYEREMEVYRAKKSYILEHNFNFKVPEYNKRLLDPMVAAQYEKDGSIINVEEADKRWENEKTASNVATATHKITAHRIEDMALKATKANLEHFKNSPSLEVSKGAEFISDIINGKDTYLNANDRDVQNANEIIKGFLFTYGKDIYNGKTDTELSVNCIKGFNKICKDMWNAKEQIELGYDDGSEAKKEYINCANECAKVIDLKNLKLEANKNELDKSIEKAEAEKLLENVEKAKNQPTEEKKSGFKEWETKLIEENTNTYFMRHTDKEIKYGAQVIQRYLDEGAANFTTKENEAKGIGVSAGWKAVKGFLDKGNDYLTKEDLRDSETSKKFIENYGNFCKEVGKLVKDYSFNSHVGSGGIEQGVKLNAWEKIDKLAKNTFTPEKVNEIFTPKQPEAEKQGFVIGN